MLSEQLQKQLIETLNNGILLILLCYLVLLQKGQQKMHAYSM